MPKVTFNNLNEDCFTTIENGFIRNNQLSLQSRGLMAILLSHSDGWKITLKNLADNAGINRETAGKYINELIKAGYVVRIRTHNKQGHLTGTAYYFSDNIEKMERFKIENGLQDQQKQPLSKNPTMDETQQNQPLPEKPASVKPASENPATLKEKEIKEKKNININNSNDISIEDEKTVFTQKQRDCYMELIKIGFSHIDSVKIAKNDVYLYFWFAWLFDKKNQNGKYNYYQMPDEHKVNSFKKYVKEQKFILSQK